MEVHGYMVEVSWDGQNLHAEGTNKAAKIALAGADHANDVMLSRNEIASVEFKSANPLVNGNLTLRTNDGRKVRLHFRRKQQHDFEGLRDALETSLPMREPSAQPAGWYTDPQDHGQLRYWDGGSWTAQSRPSTTPAPDAKEVRTAQITPTRAAASESAAGKEPELATVVATARLEPPRHPLDEQVEVVGETYHVKGIKRVFAAAKVPITAKGCTLDEIECILVPEPWSPHDTNAVAIMVGPHQVGHLPADLAVHYAAGLNRLASTGVLPTGQARIWAKDERGIVRARVTILIPEAQAFD